LGLASCLALAVRPAKALEVWPARIGESASAGISGIVGSFFLSYSLLVLGVIHNWYRIAPTAMADTQKVFVISWMVIVMMLVLATLRLPSIFAVLFTLVDVALLLNLPGIIQSSANLTKAAGWVVIAAYWLQSRRNGDDPRPSAFRPDIPRLPHDAQASLAAGDR
jgi:uncharacterized membrane protein